MSSKQKIRDFYLSETPRPTIRAICRKFGLAVGTVQHHLRDLPEYRDRNQDLRAEIYIHLDEIRRLLKRIR